MKEIEKIEAVTRAAKQWIKDDAIYSNKFTEIYEAMMVGVEIGKNSKKA